MKKSPNLKVIDNLSEFELLINYLEDKEYIAYDCETTGLSRQSEIIGFSICAEEAVAFYVVLARWNKDTQQLDYTEIKNAVSGIYFRLIHKQLIMHNAIFDCYMAESNFGAKLIKSLHTDTMILAHLLNENRKIGLKELGKTYFGQTATNEEAEMKASIMDNGGEATKDKYELYKADANLIAKYGAKDAWLTYMLFLKLVPELYEQGLDKFFYEDESMPLLKGPTYDLNTTGLVVDQNELIALEKTLKAESLQDMDFIMNEIRPHIKDKPKFNIGSNAQLSWLLFGQLELEFNTLTKEGKNVCKELCGKLPYTRSAKNDFIVKCLELEGTQYTPDATVNGKVKKGKKIKAPWSYIQVDVQLLKKLAPKHKWIERFLSYKKKMKLLTTYVEGIKERVQYGVIQPSFLQAGTTSGRYSSRNPNFQNLPRDDERVKKCIKSRPGKVFVSADYSQLEPRIFAFTSQDERLMKAFDGTSDFYSVIGIAVFGKYDALPIKEGHPNAFGIKYKKLRDLSKVIALASTYGAGARQLMKTTGKSEEDTQADIDAYFEQFPKVKDMQLESHQLAKTNGAVANYFGRLRRMPDAKRIPKQLKHEELSYEDRNLLNLAVNHRIQSTGASIINRAAITFYNNAQLADIKCKIILQVHDELVIECNEADAENVSLLLRDAMENTTTLPGMPLEAIPRISKTLAKK